MPLYAVVRTGGKQYRVEEGATVEVGRLSTPEGERVELRDVLLLADGDSVTVGRPTVPDARVVAEVLAHGRAPKITVFRYKAKTRYRRKTGHRQGFTRLAIRRIQVGDEPVEEKPAPRRRRAKAAVAKAEGETKPATARKRAAPKAAAAAAPAEPADASPAPARRTRRKAKTESGE